MDLSPEKIQKLNERNLARNERNFAQFKFDLNRGYCWVCQKPLKSFAAMMPCQHWLLMPNGFRKKHFPILYELKTYDKLEGFLRWYSNAVSPLTGINDIKDEHNPDDLMGLTISQGDLEWSFSCPPSCFSGNHNKHGPHYHFQMRIKGRQFINYGDFHIPLSEYEKWLIDIDNDRNLNIKRRDVHGMGIGSMFEQIDSDILLEGMRKTEDDKKAQFHLQTLVMSDSEKGISGDEIADLIEESKRTGVPMAQLVKRLQNVRTRVIIEPGPSIAKSAPRTRKRRGKKRG